MLRAIIAACELLEPFNEIMPAICSRGSSANMDAVTSSATKMKLSGRGLRLRCRFCRCISTR